MAEELGQVHHAPAANSSLCGAKQLTKTDDPFDDSDDGMSEGARAYHDMMADFDDSSSEEDEHEGDENQDRDFISCGLASRLKPLHKQTRSNSDDWSNEDDNDAPSPTHGSMMSPIVKQRLFRPSSSRLSNEMQYTQDREVNASSYQTPQKAFPSEGVTLSSPAPFHLGSPIIPPPAGTKRKMGDIDNTEEEEVGGKKTKRQIKKLKAKPVEVGGDEMDLD
ncbi:hypothetical protein PRZ48_008774 [Zasmidium cellare]|uniref:Uncharacterized protein n=1 Tax=Zasmidium cellare TaxID=395010 RepID=A0ABR0EGH5_ZASCE|nr:hypothetical protein PRZ48_008774 [Zasmidium cellare]